MAVMARSRSSRSASRRARRRRWRLRGWRRLAFRRPRRARTARQRRPVAHRHRTLLRNDLHGAFDRNLHQLVLRVGPAPSSSEPFLLGCECDPFRNLGLYGVTRGCGNVCGADSVLTGTDLVDRPRKARRWRPASSSSAASAAQITTRCRPRGNSGTYGCARQRASASPVGRQRRGPRLNSRRTAQSDADQRQHGRKRAPAPERRSDQIHVVGRMPMSTLAADQTQRGRGRCARAPASAKDRQHAGENEGRPRQHRPQRTVSRSSNQISSRGRSPYQITSTAMKSM